jgi:orc1/cdc6 family replication initiation protein
MGRFTQSDPVFEDEQALADDYVPETLVAREDEMSTYVEILQSVANGASPRNIFVYGDTGVGKTLATRIILDELSEDQEDFHNVSVRTVWVNCKDLTSYQVACHLVNNFRESDEQIHTSGYPRGTIHHKLWEHIDDSDATHVLFVLDEIDSLGSDDELLYQIPRARTNDKISETKIGLIGISNNFKFRDQLSARVQSTLCEHEIHFKPYNADELVQILSQRADAAFRDNVLSQAVIPFTATKVAQRTGSAREAIDILSKAGFIARDNGDSEIAESHVEKAYQQVQRGVVKDELETLPTQSHVVLYTVLALSREDKTPARRKTIYDRYKRIADQIDRDVMSPRTLHRRLNQLSLKAFLVRSEVNKGSQGGNLFKYSFDASGDIIVDVLKSESRIGETSGLKV